MCIFCDKIENNKMVLETNDWVAFYDSYPVSKGHVLLVSKEHFKTYFELPDKLKNSLHHIIKEVKELLDKEFHPDGYNIGCNCGEAAGQTVMHFHLHIIPRYYGDVENPKGGIRGCIPSKQKYE